MIFSFGSYLFSQSSTLEDVYPSCVFDFSLMNQNLLCLSVIRKQAICPVCTLVQDGKTMSSVYVVSISVGCQIDVYPPYSKVKPLPDMLVIKNVPCSLSSPTSS